MDTGIIEVRTAVTVNMNIDDTKATNSFSTFLSVNFIPDEMICKFIYYRSSNASPPAYVTSAICPGFLIPVYTTITSTGGDNIFIGSPYSPLDIHYKVTQPVYGNYQFQFLQISGNPIGDVGTIACSLILEFVKYKSVAPQKIY